MSVPTHILPIGRWIYTTESPNSTGFWFFVGEQVNQQHSPTETTPQVSLIRPNSLLKIHDSNTIQPGLENVSTEILINELMKRSPDIQRRLILDSMNPTGSQPVLHESSLTTEDNMTNTPTVSPESEPKVKDIVNDPEIPTVKLSVSNHHTNTLISQPSATEKVPILMKPEEPMYTLEEIDDAVTSKTRDHPDIPTTINKKQFKGLNEPKKYNPTIEIKPPATDPETPKKKQKTIIAEYNPEKPDITPHDRIKCKDCRRSFGNQGSYSRHYRSHHMDKEFQCGECGSTFRRKDSLQHHCQTKHHKITPKEDLKPIPKISFNIRPKYSVKDLDLPDTISPKLLSKLKNTIREHSN
jgi:hypothetical protein